MARLITKYPNRRLYDTTESRYVTLADIRRLVERETKIVVIDKKSGSDITRAVLLQIASECEQNGEPLISLDFLIQTIRQHKKVVPVVNDEAENTLTSGP
jgi:polyhydroxyalkanoate synthesis repressor PhaR